MIEDFDLLEDIIHNLAFQIRTLSAQPSMTEMEQKTLRTLKKDLKMYQKQYEPELKKQSVSKNAEMKVPSQKPDF